MHSLVSIIIGIFLGGHSQRRGHSVKDSTDVLPRSLFGRDLTDDDIVGTLDCEIDLDRAYSVPATYRSANKLGLKFTSSQTRTKCSAFIDNKANFEPAADQEVVETIGVKRVYWKRKKFPLSSCPGGRHMYVYFYFMAARNGLG